MMTISSCDNLIMTLSYYHMYHRTGSRKQAARVIGIKKSVNALMQETYRLSFAFVGTVSQRELFQAKLPLRKITSKKRDIDVDRLEVSWIRVRFEFFSPVISNQGIPSLESPFF